MKLVLDTHVFVWLVSGNKRLDGVMRRRIMEAQEGSFVLMSSISVYEMKVIERKGSFTVTGGIEKVLTRYEDEGMNILPVTKQVALIAEELPKIHRDPFDRLIAATAIAEGAALISADRKLKQYPINIIPI